VGITFAYIAHRACVLAIILIISNLSFRRKDIEKST